MGKKVKQNGLCTMERDRKEEMKMVRGRLMLEVCMPPEAMVKAVRSRLMLEICLPPGTVVMSGPGAAKGHVWFHVDVCGLYCCQRPQGCPAMLIWCCHLRPVLPPEAMVLSRPELLPGTMSGSMALQQPGSMQTSVAHVATNGHTEA